MIRQTNETKQKHVWLMYVCECVSVCFLTYLEGVVLTQKQHPPTFEYKLNLKEHRFQNLP